VVIGDAKTQKTPALMRSLGVAIERLAGRYVVAEDVGTSTDDMTFVREGTRHVVGLAPALGGSGDPSPATAWGVYSGLKQAVLHKLRADSVKGVHVAVQGLGHVGYYLCKHLVENGAKLTVTDIRPENIERVVKEFGATAVGVDEIYDVAADVYAPCALGATLNDATLPRLHATIVAGAANNQLAEARHGQALMERGILYVPDYALNAGGVINDGYEYVNGSGKYDRTQAYAHINRIPLTLQRIFEMSEAEGIPTSAAADRLAEERMGKGGPKASAAA
jgi:leucine dehydrogenase